MGEFNFLIQLHVLTFIRTVGTRVIVEPSVEHATLKLLLLLGM